MNKEKLIPLNQARWKDNAFDSFEIPKEVQTPLQPYVPELSNEEIEEISKKEKRIVKKRNKSIDNKKRKY